MTHARVEAAADGAAWGAVRRLYIYAVFLPSS